MQIDENNVALEIQPAIWSAPLPQMNKRERMDMRDRAEAMCETIHALTVLGLPIPNPDKADETTAENLMLEYAADPEEASTVFSAPTAAKMTHAALLLTQDVLERFGAQVVTDAMSIRNLVTNKLLIDSDNEDPKVRLKALELLGKISDVGLFTEKKHITIENKSTEELRLSLRDKLELLRSRAVDAEFEEIPEEVSPKEVTSE